MCCVVLRIIRQFSELFWFKGELIMCCYHFDDSRAFLGGFQFSDGFLSFHAGRCSVCMIKSVTPRTLLKSFSFHSFDIWCEMAADQQRKRLNGASIAGCNFKDQYRRKKKKLESLQNDLNTKSCISLEWDGNQKQVVAKRDQIGLSWRHLRPFTDSTIHYHRVLADVLTLPLEIFDFENLTEVLSYEVISLLFFITVASSILCMLSSYFMEFT